MSTGRSKPKTLTLLTLSVRSSEVEPCSIGELNRRGTFGLVNGLVGSSLFQFGVDGGCVLAEYIYTQSRASSPYGIYPGTKNPLPR